MKKNCRKTIGRKDFLKTSALATAFFIVPRHVMGGKNYTAPSDKIHLGYIGCGKIARSLLSDFLQTGETRTVALCDVYDTNLTFMHQRLSNMLARRGNNYRSDAAHCKTYRDFRELIEHPGLDAVVIATPDHWHSVQAIHAAKAGKDIYCEKPISFSIREGRAMAKAARDNDVVFQTGSMQRSWFEFRQTVELVRNGFIGDLEHIKVSVGGPPDPFDLPEQPVPAGLDWDFWIGPNEYFHFHRDLLPGPADDFWGRWRFYKGLGGGFMTDWGTHMFDVAQWALGMDRSGPVEIIPPGAEDNEHLLYRYASGMTMTHERFIDGNGVQFIGSEGQITVQRRSLRSTPDRLIDVIITDRHEQVYRSENHYKDWLNAIRTRTDPICNAETGHRTNTVCLLGNIAYELKRPLRWDPVREEIIGDAEAGRNPYLEKKLRPEWAFPM